MECCFTLFLCLSSGNSSSFMVCSRCWRTNHLKTTSLWTSIYSADTFPYPGLERIVCCFLSQKSCAWSHTTKRFPIGMWTNFGNGYHRWPIENRPKPVLPFQDITSVQLHNLDPKKRIQIQWHPQAAGSGPWVYLDCGWEQRIKWGRMPRKDCFPVAIMSTICLNFGH